jgi:hypothetical protein
LRGIDKNLGFASGMKIYSAYAQVGAVRDFRQGSVFIPGLSQENRILSVRLAIEYLLYPKNTVDKEP